MFSRRIVHGGSGVGAITSSLTGRGAFSGARPPVNCCASGVGVVSAAMGVRPCTDERFGPLEFPSALAVDAPIDASVADATARMSFERARMR